MEPVRVIREAASYKTVERSSNYLKVPKAAIRINTQLLEFIEYIH
jgi:hypothetical protein